MEKGEEEEERTNVLLPIIVGESWWGWGNPRLEPRRHLGDDTDERRRETYDGAPWNRFFVCVRVCSLERKDESEEQAKADAEQLD